jgi:hypothetical protein
VISAGGPVADGRRVQGAEPEQGLERGHRGAAASRAGRRWRERRAASRAGVVGGAGVVWCGEGWCAWVVPAWSVLRRPGSTCVPWADTSRHLPPGRVRHAGFGRFRGIARGPLRARRALRRERHPRRRRPGIRRLRRPGPRAAVPRRHTSGSRERRAASRAGEVSGTDVPDGTGHTSAESAWNAPATGRLLSTRGVRRRRHERAHGGKCRSTAPNPPRRPSPEGCMATCVRLP